MTDLTDLTAAVASRLMLIQPSNWASLVVHSQHQGGSWVVYDIEGRVDTRHPLVRYQWCESDRQALLLNADVAALHMRSALEGRGWNGAMLVLLRPLQGPITVHAYSGPDEEPAFTVHLQPERLLTGVPLLLAIEASVDLMSEQMVEFYDRLGPYRAQRSDVVHSAHRFEVPEGQRSFPMTAIGSFHHEQGVWRWAWGVSTLRAVPGFTEPVAALRTAPNRGMGVFSTASFPSDPTFSGWLALLAGHRLQRIVHRVDRPGVTTYYALSDTGGTLEKTCATSPSLPA